VQKGACEKSVSCDIWGKKEASSHGGKQVKKRQEGKHGAEKVQTKGKTAKHETWNVKMRQASRRQEGKRGAT
jgi:hypothetical protein